MGCLLHFNIRSLYRQVIGRDLRTLCVAVCCSVWQRVAACCSSYIDFYVRPTYIVFALPKATPNALQRTTTHCNSCNSYALLSRFAFPQQPNCNTLQHTATHCNVLHAAHTTHCNTLTELLCNTCNPLMYPRTATALQHTATHCMQRKQRTATPFCATHVIH